MGLLRPAVLLTILLLCVSSVCVHVKGEVKESADGKVIEKTPIIDGENKANVPVKDKTESTKKTVNGTITTVVERIIKGKDMVDIITTVTEVTPEETIVTVLTEHRVGKAVTYESTQSRTKNTNVTYNETQTVITSSKTESKSATTISSTIP
eukprot:Tbor_TRINITY_DN5459_c0_g1::TRINITY_DN5459_c0_g1_i5::g.24560::m.24560